MTSRIKQMFTLLVVALMGFACLQPKSELVILAGNTMGTTYTVKYWSSNIELDPQSLSAEIDRDLMRVNQQMSTYIDDSELMRLNRWPAAERFLFRIVCAQCLLNRSDYMVSAKVALMLPLGR